MWANPMGRAACTLDSTGVAATKAANSGVACAAASSVGSRAARRSKYAVPTEMVKGVKPYMVAMHPISDSSGTWR